MFQMVNDEQPSAETRKLFWMKTGLFIVGIALLVGVGYFFAFQK